MNPDATVCDVVGCHSPATGSYLHAARPTAVQFALCDDHLAQLRQGGQPVVRAAAPGRPTALLIE